MSTATTSSLPKTLAGTHDWYGYDERCRQLLVQTTRRIYESFGFEPLSTPAMELQEVLYREQGDNTQKIFEVLICWQEVAKERGEAKKGRVVKAPTASESPKETATRLYEQASRLTSWLEPYVNLEHQPIALRFDHTIPLARFAAQNIKELALPWKRYAIGPVWRAEKPQKGRLREFTQVDFDTIGASSSAADAEVVAILCTVANAVGLESYSAIFNHRRLLETMAVSIGASDRAQISEILRSWDKIGKPEFQKVAGKLEESGLSNEEITRFNHTTEFLRDIRGTNDHLIQRLRAHFSEERDVQASLDLIEGLLGLCSRFSQTEGHIVFRPYLARGLDYYTGPVFEMVTSKSRHSFAGGGRFDQLIERCGGPDTPATGASFGLERFVEVVEEEGTLFAGLTSNHVYVTVFNQDSACLSASITAAQIARSAGFSVEMYSGEEKLGRQLTVANRKGYHVALILGPDEIASSAVTVKDMTAEYNVGPSNQSQIPLSDLEVTLRKMLQ